MAITLDALALPAGLRWSDEFDWTGAVQQTGYTVAGALVVEESQRQAGRPITLLGGQRWAWITRAELDILHAALTAEGAAFVLTLHDGRTFDVIPRQDAQGPIEARPLPVVGDSGPADPGAETRYVLETLRLIEV